MTMKNIKELNRIAKRIYDMNYTDLEHDINAQNTVLQEYEKIKNKDDEQWLSTIDWLTEKYEKFLAWYEGNHKAEPYTLEQLSNDFHMAKERYKKDIMKAYTQGTVDEAGEILDVSKDSLEYYNKTYKQKQ